MFYFVLFSDNSWYLAFSIENAKELIANHRWDEYTPEGLRWYKVFAKKDGKLYEEVLTNL